MDFRQLYRANDLINGGGRLNTTPVLVCVEPGFETSVTRCDYRSRKFFA